MTQEIQVPTAFADLAELTDHFVHRVDEQVLILPHRDPVPAGEWVRFEVLLADGSTAFAGLGRVQECHDNGEAHPPEYRYDVVLDSLQFEGMNEVLFERLLVARETMMRGEPATGEVGLDQLESIPFAESGGAMEGSMSLSEGAGDVESAEAAEPGWEDVSDEPMQALEGAGLTGGTGTGPFGEFGPRDLREAPGAPRSAPPAARSASPPGRSAPPPARSTPPPGRSAPPAAPTAPPPRAEASHDAASGRSIAGGSFPFRTSQPGQLPSPHTFNGRLLLRDSLPSSWPPKPAPRPAPAQSSGLFEYRGGLPCPMRPPRPELEPGARIQPAPRPGAPWVRNRARAKGVERQPGSTSGASSAFQELDSDWPTSAASDATSQVEAPPGEPWPEEE